MLPSDVQRVERTVRLINAYLLSGYSSSAELPLAISTVTYGRGKVTCTHSRYRFCTDYIVIVVSCEAVALRVLGLPLQSPFSNSVGSGQRHAIFLVLDRFICYLVRPHT